MFLANGHSNSIGLWVTDDWDGNMVPFSISVRVLGITNKCEVKLIANLNFLHQSIWISVKSLYETQSCHWSFSAPMFYDRGTRIKYLIDDRSFLEFLPTNIFAGLYHVVQLTQANWQAAQFYPIAATVVLEAGVKRLHYSSYNNYLQLHKNSCFWYYGEKKTSHFSSEKSWTTFILRMYSPLQFCISHTCADHLNAAFPEKIINSATLTILR